MRGYKTLFEEDKIAVLDKDQQLRLIHRKQMKLQ
jgi:hypothetical protein